MSVLFLAVMAALGAGSATGSPPVAATVHINNFSFVPAKVTVSPGSTVRFINDDTEAHTVTAANRSFDSGGRAATLPDGPYFVQISDSHIGFHQDANPDVAGTLNAVVDGINGLTRQPQFVMHTGDVTHLAKPEQFDTAKQILGRLRAPLIALPGEHDVLATPPAAFLAAFPSPERSKGWFSWDARGVHYVALVNVFDFEQMGLLCNEQLAWLQRDLALLARFDAVTVLNGHIHQVVEHTEGNIRFATANATAYPQPAPGTAAKPGPKALPHDELLRTIGYRTVELIEGSASVRNVTLA